MAPNGKGAVLCSMRIAMAGFLSLHSCPLHSMRIAMVSSLSYGEVEASYGELLELWELLELCHHAD